MLGLVPSLLIPAVSLAFVGLVQGASISATYPNPDGRYPDMSRDFSGQGIANIASGLVGGTATWRIEFPLVVSYESSQGVESTQRLVATVLVRRASTVKTPRGVVIQQAVLKRDS